MSQAPIKIENEENLWEHLLTIEAKDVNLKFLFDHVTYYGICGLMLKISIWVFAYTRINIDTIGVVRGMFNYLSGGVLFGLSFGLFALNAGHAFKAYQAIRASKATNLVLYSVVSILLFLAASNLMLYAFYA